MSRPSQPRRPSGAGRGRPAGAPGRREQEARPAAAAAPGDLVPGPEDTRAALPTPLRAALGSLSKDVSDEVAGHLAAAQRLWPEDPDVAVQHALRARDRARRVAAVREAVGLLLYTVTRFEEALPELRAARRMSGRDDLLPVVADCERGVGRPEKALDVLAGTPLETLPPAVQVEAALVASGAHRDLGRARDAVALLRPVVERSPRDAEWRARLSYAYADALLEAGDRGAARDAFAAAAAADPEEETDAAERLSELDEPAEGVTGPEEER